MADTPSNGIPYSPEGVVDPAAGLNDALRVIDVLLQLRIVGILNTLPTGVADGNRYLVGTTPTGVAVGHAGEVARYVATGAFYTFHDANYAILDDVLYIKSDAGVWAAYGGGGSVTSVNGDTGPAVVLDAADVGAAPSSHVGSGGSQHANVVAAGAAGFMTGTDKTKLDGVAAGATANSSDATLLDRANHTGTQLAATIGDFADTVRATLLTGYVATTTTAIAATDTVLQAFGKVGAYLAALGTAAFKNTGTSGNNVPLLDGANTWTTNQSIGGNLTMTGVGGVIQGDFSDVVIANRTALQTSVVNGNTTMVLKPNGTSTIANLTIVDNPTGPTYSRFIVGINGVAGECSINSTNVTAGGTVLPIKISVNSIVVLTMNTNGGSLFGGPVGTHPYSLATLPAAATFPRAMIYVSDMTGGAQIAYSDGVNWRRMSDLSVAS